MNRQGAKERKMGPAVRRGRQRGFKLFRREICQEIFPRCRIISRQPWQSTGLAITSQLRTIAV